MTWQTRLHVWQQGRAAARLQHILSYLIVLVDWNTHAGTVRRVIAAVLGRGSGSCGHKSISTVKDLATATNWVEMWTDRSYQEGVTAAEWWDRPVQSRRCSCAATSCERRWRFEEERRVDRCTVVAPVQRLRAAQAQQASAVGSTRTR